MLDRTAADKLTVSLMSDNGGWEIIQRCHIISCWSLGGVSGFDGISRVARGHKDYFKQVLPITSHYI